MSEVLSTNEIKTIFQHSERLFSAQQIEQALSSMANQIHADLENEMPVVLCVLIGGIVLTGKLLTLLDFPLQVDYIHATRYRDKTVGEQLEWIAKPRVSLKNRSVLIIDDILDKGVTLAHIVQYCKSQQAKMIKTAVVVEKDTHRDPNAVQKADYTGLVVEDKFVFGYGMDYKGYLRNAPGIYAITKEL